MFTNLTGVVVVFTNVVIFIVLINTVRRVEIYKFRKIQTVRITVTEKRNYMKSVHVHT